LYRGYGPDDFTQRDLASQIQPAGCRLQTLAQDDPQAAYSALTKGICSRWTHCQRTVPNISGLFEPLENAIKDQLIPPLVG